MFRPEDKVLTVALFVVAAVMALISVGIATNIGGISSLGLFWLVWPLLAVLMLLIIWGVRGIEKWLRQALPGLRFGLTLAVLAFVTFAVVTQHNDEQRCVQKDSMTVVPAVDCQHQNISNQDIWYYGGQGTRVGDTVENGSFTPPAEDNGGGSGGTSGDTGDDGGDDGGDGGGGDGGGGD